jgi:hypothetical protein
MRPPLRLARVRRGHMGVGSFVVEFGFTVSRSNAPGGLFFTCFCCPIGFQVGRRVFQVPYHIAEAVLPGKSERRSSRHSKQGPRNKNGSSGSSGTPSQLAASPRGKWLSCIVRSLSVTVSSPPSKIAENNNDFVYLRLTPIYDRWYRQVCLIAVCSKADDVSAVGIRKGSNFPTGALMFCSC